jgi:hypothetical protein
LQLALRRIAELESALSAALAKLERLPKDDDDASVPFCHAIRKKCKVA